MFRQSGLFAILIILVVTPVLAGEGKWTPQQVLEIDPAWLKEQGLELPPERLWDPERGTGLLAATVRIPGCTGGLISADGLLLTNYHCLFDLVQEHSTPDNDLITNGFLARTRAEELPGRTMRMEVARRFSDVTADIEAVAGSKKDDGERWRAIERRQKEMVAECETQPDTRCAVVAFDDGVRYTMIEYDEIRDVRLVWAPPRAVGEYGGEIDNWMWPRHTGDFAMARAWVGRDGRSAAHAKENVPYASEFFFPISREGVGEGDFVMVLGYPGRTYRAWVAPEVDERRDLYFPARVDLYGEWISLMERLTESSEEGKIAVAGNLKSLHNRYKNARGQIEGLDRGRIPAGRRAEDREVLDWAADKPEWKSAVAAYGELETMVADARRTWNRDFLLDNLGVGARSLDLARTIVRNARERQKSDLDRDPAYQDRNSDRLRRSLDREQKNIELAVDKALFLSFVRRALELDGNQRIAVVDRMFGEVAGDEDALRARIDALYAKTAILDLEQRARMFDETPDQIAKRGDPMLELAIALDDQLEILKKTGEARKGLVSRARPAWRRAVMAHAGKPIAPDANSTLRVSFAHVRGYLPRDGVAYTPRTTLSGVIAKHTGAEPFDVPATLREAAANDRSEWADPALGDVPVCFLADGDTTGGNSGSPVVDGRGRMVGVNFDRVWENVANDFGYNPDIARNVSVDVRYMLWILDEVVGAGELLEELGVARRAK
jgi:hypothetical protein